MYNQTGNYVAVAGVVVFLLAKFGVVAQATDVVQVIAGVAALIGIAKQFFDHKKLAVVAGVMPQK